MPEEHFRNIERLMPQDYESARDYTIAQNSAACDLFNMAIKGQVSYDTAIAVCGQAATKLKALSVMAHEERLFIQEKAYYSLAEIQLMFAEQLREVKART